ncbi:MAG: replicative DNA helicase, partial [Armatimonadota bacterium]
MQLLLRAEDFYRPAHRAVYDAMLRLLQDRSEIDIVTLKEELVERGELGNVGGLDYLIEIAEYVPSPKNARFYAQIVLDRATLRRLERAARNIVGIVHEPDGTDADEKVDQAEKEIFEVGQRHVGKDFTPVTTLAETFFKEVDDVFATKKPLNGAYSGFIDLDKMTAGFFPGDFVIVGARPSMGKTSLVLDFALNVARGLRERQAPAPVAIFSLEMSGLQLT